MRIHDCDGITEDYPIVHFPELNNGIQTVPTATLTTDEDGGTAVFSVGLGSAPIADVTVGVSSSDTTEATLGVVSFLTFSADAWYTELLVTVTGVSDVEADGNVTFSVNVGASKSSDSNYEGLDGNDVSVRNVDGGQLAAHCVDTHNAHSPDTQTHA
jgi:hypothetical protein